ncbi:hypothetical protein BDW69DRAFT_196775 [Aspergillus filifer]
MLITSPCSSRARRIVAIITIAFLIVLALFQLSDVSQYQALQLPTFQFLSAILSSGTHVDWSRFAYVQYALHRLGSNADRVMMYPAEFESDDHYEIDEKRTWLLMKARDDFGVKLVPIEVQEAESYTKLLAFNQTQYDRHSVDLFLSPSAPHTFTSLLLLIQLVDFEFERIQSAMANAGPSDYDIEIMNTLYKNNAMVIPHRPYTMLSGEFRATSHEVYLGHNVKDRDPKKEFEQAPFVHSSDWPLPKPWAQADEGTLAQHQPPCLGYEDGNVDCNNHEIWTGLYEVFRKRRLMSIL